MGTALKTLAFCWLFAGSVRAAAVLPQVFSDHMVLQANMATPIFGTAAPGEQVAVAINDQKKTAAADKDGKWTVRLDAMKPGGPFELRVSATNTLAVKDVLVGEVWLASGQSNMKFPLNRAANAPAEMGQANFPQIRYTNGSKWVVCSPQTCGSWSAVAFFFAVELQQHSKSPVGIIETAVNGALCQAFISKAALDADQQLLADVSKHNKDDIAIHWNSLLAPVAGYGIQGALWFQGEGNRDFPVTYRKLLSALIADWRKQWGQGDFPFLVCQLTNFQQKKPEPWEGKDCALRESQLKVVQAVPNTALVVTVDLNDGTDVHFPNKKPCGQRLALAARGIAYGEKIEYSGPIFKAAKFEGGKATVSFTHVGGGLSVKGGTLTGFLLCGADKKWVRAEVAIAGDEVVVKNDKVAQAVAVRYGWERNPDCNLYNKEGLPASPFRSDDYINYFTRDNNPGEG
ncbi:MAG: sialate O-acetylesterase [Planctomycetota bacterium]